jgi:hypothetical protein
LETDVGIRRLLRRLRLRDWDISNEYGDEVLKGTVRCACGEIVSSTFFLNSRHGETGQTACQSCGRRYRLTLGIRIEQLDHSNEE